MADPAEDWQRDFRKDIRRETWRVWRKDARQSQGFGGGLLLAGVGGFLYWLSHNHGWRAVHEMELLAWTVPAFILWLIYRWMHQWALVHSALAYRRQVEVNAQNDRIDRIDRQVNELAERLRPRLIIEGGDGAEFDWTVQIEQVYRRLALASEPDVSVLEAGRMKVLRVTNVSDAGIEKVRVDATLPISVAPIAVPLMWFDSGLPLADIGPRSSHHVVLGMKARLSRNIEGTQHEFERATMYLDAWAEGKVLRVKVWAPGDVIGDERTFQLGTPALPNGTQWFPTLTPVDEP